MTANPPPSATLRSIAVAVPDTAIAEKLLCGLAELPVTVRDGARWTALDAGGVTLALTVPDELPGGAVVSINLKVANVEVAHQFLLAAGGQSVVEPTITAHEERAAVRLGETVVLSVYRPLR